MPRRSIPKISEFPYHITARTNNCDWFSIPLSEVWKIFSFYLQKINKNYNAQILAFVLMSNHFHLLLRTPDFNLGSLMNYFQREVSKNIGRASAKINHVFGGSYNGCLVSTEIYLYHVYKYIYRNPVEAGLATKVETYPYSTLKNLLQQTRLPYPLMDELAVKWSSIPQNMEKRVDWLNIGYSEQQKELIRLGLRRRVFQFPRYKKYQITSQQLMNAWEKGT